MDNGNLQGRNGLVKLALRLFSIIANSAGCERVFSGFGIIHVAHRNKLKYKKVHNTALVKLDILQKQRDAGVGTRKKRRYGDPDGPEPTALIVGSSSTATTSEPDTIQDPSTTPFLDQDPANFADHAQQLIVGSQTCDEDALPAAPAAPPTTTARSTRQQKIPLARLFDYSVLSEKGVGFYWEGAKQNLEVDELVHDVLHAALGGDVPST